MKKLVLEKITLNELTPIQQNKVIGGYDETTGEACIGTTITVTTVATPPITYSVVISCMDCYPSNDCLTKKPGHQDSCGLCTTNFACPSKHIC